MKVYTNVWKLRPGTSLAGELMKTSVLEPRTISTSVMLAVVTGSQTLRVFPPPLPFLSLVAVTSLSGAPGQATWLCGCTLGYGSQENIKGLCKTYLLGES